MRHIAKSSRTIQDVSECHEWQQERVKHHSGMSGFFGRRNSTTILVTSGSGSMTPAGISLIVVSPSILNYCGNTSGSQSCFRLLASCLSKSQLINAGSLCNPCYSLTKMAESGRNSGGDIFDMAKDGTTVPEDSAKPRMIPSKPRPDQIASEADPNSIGGATLAEAADNARDIPRVCLVPRTSFFEVYN